jgi:hypothetical protein
MSGNENEKVFWAAHLAFEIAECIVARRHMAANGPFAEISEEQVRDQSKHTAITTAYVMEFLNQVFGESTFIVGFFPNGVVTPRYDPKGYIMDPRPFPWVLPSEPAGADLLMRDLYAELSAIMKKNGGSILVKGAKKSLSFTVRVLADGVEMIHFV